MYTQFAKPDREITMHNRKKHAESLVDYINNNTDKYNSIVKYAKDNYNKLATQAAVSEGGVSIADQIQMNTDCPYFIAEEVARSVTFLKQV